MFPGEKVGLDVFMSVSELIKSRHYVSVHFACRAKDYSRIIGKAGLPHATSIKYPLLGTIDTAYPASYYDARDWCIAFKREGGAEY